MAATTAQNGPPVTGVGRAALSVAQRGAATAQGVVLHRVLGLPEAVQRRLVGAPVVREGQRLATDTQLLLRLRELTPGPAAEDVPVAQGRRQLLLDALSAGGRPPVGAVTDTVVPVDDDGPARTLPARLYTPTGTDVTVPGPLLVFFHGGGWIHGDLDSHDAPCRVLAERAGVRVLSVAYRLAPEHPFPAAREDAVAAYAWVVQHAADLGADPERLAVGGDSAGGNLAAVTALAAARTGLPCAFQLLVYPATDLTRSAASHRTYGEGFFLTNAFMDLAAASYVPAEEQQRHPHASPLFDELDDLDATAVAPAHVVTAGFDPLRDEGEAYVEKLRAAGVAVELRRCEEMIHGFLNIGAGRSAPRRTAELADALRRGLGA